MNRIRDGKDLEAAITKLKTASLQQQTVIQQRLGSPGAVLSKAWTLLPWARRKRTAQNRNIPDAEVHSGRTTPATFNPDEHRSFKSPKKMAIKDYLTKQAFKNGFTILKAAFSGFMNDLALKYSASLAYYTIFSLGPLLLLVISLAGIFLGKDAIQGKVFSEINGFVGNEAARQ